jgi:hypothetical protein
LIFKEAGIPFRHQSPVLAGNSFIVGAAIIRNVARIIRPRQTNSPRDKNSQSLSLVALIDGFLLVDPLMLVPPEKF